MFEQGAGELEPLFIPTFIVKDGVETLYDMAYLWGRATTAAGFLGFDGVSYYSFDGKDLANSSQIEYVHFGQPPQGN
jgi:hypothetical protein